GCGLSGSEGGSSRYAPGAVRSLAYASGLCRSRERRHNAWIGADSPTNAALDEVLEARITPGSLVVAPGGVEDAAFAVFSDPRPRLPAVTFLAIFEHRAIGLVVLCVDIRLVPAFKAAEAAHDRVLAFSQDGAKRARAVPLKLSPDQLDVFGRVQEAVRRAVERDEPLAAGDIVEQSLLLFGGDARGVGIDDQAVIFAE